MRTEKCLQDKQFDWAGYHWVIPAVYSRNKELVIDFCMQIDMERIQNFVKKWHLSEKEERFHHFYEQLTREQQMQIDLENPFCFEFRPCLELNGQVLESTQGCSVSFSPYLSDEMSASEEIAIEMAEHYRLDKSCGWVIYRWMFPWERKHSSEIRTLSITMKPQAVQVPGAHFKVCATGDSFQFSHPFNGRKYTLTMKELKQQRMSQSRLSSGRWIFPMHFIEMSYTISPEPMEDILVMDSADGDNVREITSMEKENYLASCDVVIGGDSGPVSIVVEDSLQGNIHVAASSLYFEPFQGDVEWCIVFSIKQADEASFLLI